MEKVSGAVVKVEEAQAPVALKDYLQTYQAQLEGMEATFAWAKRRLTPQQRQEWERTIESIKVVCRVLDAGFEPINPPRNWSSGVLNQYLAPIPEAVRERIDRALPVFGPQHILIYDPNEEHFSRPKHTDPLVVGYCDLAQQRLHFLIGQWDLGADLKFIKGERRDRAVQTTMRRLGQVISMGPLPASGGSTTMPIMPYIGTISTTAKGTEWLSQTKHRASYSTSDHWVANMTAFTNTAS